MIQTIWTKRILLKKLMYALVKWEDSYEMKVLYKVVQNMFYALSTYDLF